ncbi:MAG: dienelactone hydrolase family protein [Opitutus sp.]
MHTIQDTLRFGQPLAKARGALILIHGRGASAEDIAGLAESLNVQEFALFAPEAENNTWYPQRFFVPLAQNEPWLSGALATIDGLANEAIAGGLRPEQIGVIGFSQGACLAVEHLVRSGRRYGFVGALSGALIGPAGTVRPQRDLLQTPVMLGCAENDAHIPREFVEQSAIELTAMNADVTKQIYGGGAHTVFPQEVTWLNEQLARMNSGGR